MLLKEKQIQNTPSWKIRIILLQRFKKTLKKKMHSWRVLSWRYVLLITRKSHETCRKKTPKYFYPPPPLFLCFIFSFPPHPGRRGTAWFSYRASTEAAFVCTYKSQCKNVCLGGRAVFACVTVVSLIFLCVLSI